jgi:hypothetical protein
VQGQHAAYGPYTFITPLEESYFGVFEAQSGTCLKPGKKVGVPGRIRTGRIQHTHYGYMKFMPSKIYLEK